MTAVRLRLSALGRDAACLRAGGRELRLSPRQSEIVVLLAERPAGLTSEQLAVELYGDAAKPGTARVEISRLRRIAPVGAEPYRLTAPVESDVGAVRARLRAGRIRAAAALHRAPLLPRSAAPGVVALRDDLTAWVRHAVLTADDVDALWMWASAPVGTDDVGAWRRFLAHASDGDPRRALAAARVAHLGARSPAATVLQPPLT